MTGLCTRGGMRRTDGARDAPAAHAGHRLDLQRGAALRLVEGLDVIIRRVEGAPRLCIQLWVWQVLFRQHQS